MSDCKGKTRNNCRRECFFTNGVKLKYCRKRRGKKSCRGRDIDICYEEGKCKLAQGDSRRFCRKTFNNRSSLSKTRKSNSVF